MKFQLCIVVIAAICSSMINAYSITLPHEKVGIFGQEEIGPIDNFTCTEEGLFPDDECDQFITCWDKRAVLWRCTEEMLYDLRYNGCDYAENVDCGDRRRDPGLPGTRTPPTTSTTTDPSASTTSSTPPPNSTYECTENGAFPHAERCEYYWNCWEGVASLEHCPLDYLFDLAYDGCNFPDMVDCGERQRPEPVSTTTRNPTTSGSTPSRSTEAPSTTPSQGSSSSSTSAGTTGNPVDFECPSPNGVFPDPEDCGGYFTCVENTPIHATCPEGLHFNPDTELCDWPDQANCSSE